MIDFYKDLNGTSNLENYFRQYLDCVGHCQTNMITGHTCGHSDISLNSNISHYKYVLQNLQFFGLTDYWIPTVCLFHAMFGGACKVVELWNVRKSKNPFSKYLIYNVIYNLTHNFEEKT